MFEMNLLGMWVNQQKTTTTTLAYYIFLGSKSSITHVHRPTNVLEAFQHFTVASL